MSTAKAERLQIRVGPEEKHLLERAANTLHVSVSAFVLSASASEAASVLAERPLIELTPAAARAFSRALQEPAKVNERLASALDRPRKFTWLD